MAIHNSGVVVVCGATGRQGGAVTRHLLANGWRVRALTRKPEAAKARRVAELGAEVVRADMGDRASLDAAFGGAHGVYSVQNPMISGLEAEVLQGRNVASAAKDAGVRHLVYGSAGVGTPTGVGSWDSKLAVEEHLRELALPTTVLRPMAFMELMSDRGFFPPASTWHVMPKLMGADRQVAWLAVDDLGAIAAKAFAEPERFVGQTLALTADTQTIDECRAIWQEVRGRRPPRFPMPVWLFERVAGRDLTTMWRWLHEADLTFETATTRALHPGARSVRQWLEARTERKEEG